MTKEYKQKLVGTLIVPIGLAAILIPFSLLIGWNPLTLLLFWLVIIPALVVYLPTIVSNKKNLLFESSIGLLIFYALMVFMIYEHYQSDYFLVMIFSGVINLMIVFVATKIRTANAAFREAI